MTYNAGGQIKDTARSNDSYAWTGHYNVNRPYASNGLNQLTQSGSVTPTYDGRGNLTSAGGNSYGYDGLNMLVSASNGTTLNYDSLNRLVQYGATASPRRFVYEGVEIAAEADHAAGAIAYRSIRGDGPDEHICGYSGDGTASRHWYHSDERGSSVAVTDSAGTVTAINCYDEYGIPAATLGLSNETDTRAIFI